MRNRPLRDVRDAFVGGGWSARRDPRFRAAIADPVAALRANFAASPSVEVLDLDGAVPEVGPAPPRLR